MVKRVNLFPKFDHCPTVAFNSLTASHSYHNREEYGGKASGCHGHGLMALWEKCDHNTQKCSLKNHHSSNSVEF